MLYIKMVMEYLSVDKDFAEKVVDEMAIEGFDFSESSDRQFKLFADYAYKNLLEFV